MKKNLQAMFVVCFEGHTQPWRRLIAKTPFVNKNVTREELDVWGKNHKWPDYPPAEHCYFDGWV